MKVVVTRYPGASNMVTMYGIDRGEAEPTWVAIVTHWLKTTDGDETFPESVQFQAFASGLLRTSEEIQLYQEALQRAANLSLGLSRKIESRDDQARKSAIARTMMKYNRALRNLAKR